MEHHELKGSDFDDVLSHRRPEDLGGLAALVGLCCLPFVIGFFAVVELIEYLRNEF